MDKISEIDSEITALSDLKRVINDFIQKMIEKGIKHISALSLLYEEMDKQLELIEGQKPITYEMLENISERLSKPVDPAIIRIPEMRMLTSFLKSSPCTSDVDGF